MDMADISVIIVSYKGAERLALCLSSLAGAAGGKVTAEVIITDNRSEDEGIDKLQRQYPQFTFLNNEVNGGFANGCNLGASHASGEYLLFLNPDTVVTREAIEKMLFKAQNYPPLTLCSCRQERENGTESIACGVFPSLWNLTGLQRAIGRLIRGSSTVKTDPEDRSVWFPDWVSGSVILIRRIDFETAGGFDSDYWMYYEDVDLCRRITDMGGRVALFRDITIEHNHGGSSRINVRTASMTKCEVMISRHLYISKHKKGLERMTVQSFMVLNNLITGIIPAIAGAVMPFWPKTRVRVLIFAKLKLYYFRALLKRSWLSHMSVNYPGKVTG